MVKPARKKLDSKSAETPPALVETETIVIGGLTDNPLPLNDNMTVETKEESVPEVPAEEETDKLSFLTEKPNVEEKPKKKTFLTIIVMLVVFLLGMLAGGFIVYKKGNIFAGKKETVAEKQEQVTPSPAPSEEPVDLAKYTIEVLNGSGTKGVAGELKDSLVKEGFDVSSAGNATSSAFAKTVIRAKKEVGKEYLKKLQAFLLKSYILSETQELEDTEKTDVVVIIGAE